MPTLLPSRFVGTVLSSLRCFYFRTLRLTNAYFSVLDLQINKISFIPLFPVQLIIIFKIILAITCLQCFLFIVLLVIVLHVVVFLDSMIITKVFTAGKNTLFCSSIHIIKLSECIMFIIVHENNFKFRHYFPFIFTNI